VKLVLLVLLSLTSGCFAADDEQFTVIGTIDKLLRNQISVKTPRGAFPIGADEKTEIMKDKPYHDLSALKVGEEIAVQCKPDAAGKLVAVKFWANVVNFAATVKEVRDQQIEVETSSKDGQEHKIVRFYPDTAFGTNRSDLAAGQQLRVVGLDVGNGIVDASRIALYNTDVPADKGTRK
jgi:hypothetical protein